MAKDKKPPQPFEAIDLWNALGADYGVHPIPAERMQPAQPSQGMQEPVPASQVLAEKPTARRMTQERVRKAMDTLLKYKAGKARLESRLVEVEQWWKLRHWEWMQEQGAKSDIWSFSCIPSGRSIGPRSKCCEIVSE